MIAVAAFAACSTEATETPAAGGYGELAVHGTVSTVLDAWTRAQVELPAGTTIPQADAMALAIESTDAENPYFKEWTAVSEYSAKKDLLYATTYDVRIHSAEADDAMTSDEGVNRPYFEGSRAVEVPARQQTPVTVTAALANAIVRIEFTDDFKGYFPNGAQFTLTTEAGSEFTTGYTADDHDTAELCWFIRPASFSIAGSAVKQTPSATVEPETVTFAETAGTAEARTFYTYTFDVKGVGSGTVNIALNDTPIATDESDNELNDDAKAQ